MRIDIDPGELRQGADPQVAIQADLKSALAALTAEAKRRQLQSFSAWCEEARGRYNDHRKRWAAGPPAGKCTSHHLVEALRPLLDEDILFLVDGGNIGQWVHQLFGDRYPENWVTCGASAVIGWGLGGAIAAKKEFPDRPVLLLSGDGSFGFTIAEIETAVRQCTPFVAVVADDQQWGIVACGQRKQYGKEGVLASALGPTRYDQVAKGFGANGIYIESINQLLPTVREALTAPCVTVIHVPVLHAGPSD